MSLVFGGYDQDCGQGRHVWASPEVFIPFIFGEVFSVCNLSWITKPQWAQLHLYSSLLQPQCLALTLTQTSLCTNTLQINQRKSKKLNDLFSPLDYQLFKCVYIYMYIRTHIYLFY